MLVFRKPLIILASIFAPFFLSAQPAASFSTKKPTPTKLPHRRVVLQKISLLLTSLLLSPAKAMSSVPQVPTEASCLDSEKVVVIGANGQVGYKVVKLLHESPRYRPIAMIREAAQASKFEDLGVQYFVGDLDSSSPMVEDLEGAHAVIFAAGAGRSRPPSKKVTIDYLAAVRSVVNAQETQSVKRFILLSGINTDPNGTRRTKDSTDLSGPLSAWHRLKAHSETYLKESHLHGRALDWTILCPSRLVDDPGTGKVKCSLIHGEDDLRNSLTDKEKEAALRVMPGSHDGKNQRLCISRDNTAATLVGLLGRDNTIGKSVTVIDGIIPVVEALSMV